VCLFSTILLLCSSRQPSENTLPSLYSALLPYKYPPVLQQYSAFEAKGYRVYGMSADAPAAQASWKADNGFKYPLLCDTDHKARPAGRPARG